MNHFARVCKNPNKKSTVGRFEDWEDSETEELNRIIVTKIDTNNPANNLEAKVSVKGLAPNKRRAVPMKLITDSGV